MELNRGADHLAERVTRIYVGALWLAMPAVWFFRNVLTVRHFLSCDGIAYIDIANQCVRGNWHALVNGYWSPGYPAIASIWLRLLHPGMSREILYVHILGWLALIAALFSFRFFLSTLLRRLDADVAAAPTGQDAAAPLPRWAFRTIGYTLFFWTTVLLFPDWVDTPDVFVLSALLLAGGISFQIVNGANSWTRYALLGAVLGCAYLIKAPMLPLSAVFLVTTLLSSYKRPRAITGILVSTLVLSAISAPFIYALSKDKGRFTFGDSGAINYAIAVNYIDPTVYWQGQPPGSGTPKHPIEKLEDDPPVYSYFHNYGVSYPPWYDHSYFYDGVRPHLEWTHQLSVIRIALHTYAAIVFWKLGALVAGLLILFFGGGNLLNAVKRLLSAFPLWGPAGAGLLMFALVHVELRFLGGFIVLVFAACLYSLRMRIARITATEIRGIALTVVLVLGVQIALSANQRPSFVIDSQDDHDWRVAAELHFVGVTPGDGVGLIGEPLMNHIWAHLARVTIMADVPITDQRKFWADYAENTKAFTLALERSSFCWIAMDVPPERIADGWRRLPDTNYYVLSFHRTF